jgi:hypothetical protein
VKSRFDSAAQTRICSPQLSFSWVWRGCLQLAATCVISRLLRRNNSKCCRRTTCWDAGQVYAVHKCRSEDRLRWAEWRGTPSCLVVALRVHSQLWRTLLFELCWLSLWCFSKKQPGAEMRLGTSLQCPHKPSAFLRSVWQIADPCPPFVQTALISPSRHCNDDTVLHSALHSYFRVGGPGSIPDQSTLFVVDKVALGQFF